MMITITIIFGPITLKIPSTAKIHKSSKTEAIACKGRGKMPIAQPITKSISISHKVTGWLFIEKRTMFGIEITVMGAYPKNQRMMRIIMIVVSIGYSAIATFLITVSFGKYLIRAFSTKFVKVSSSITAWAFACLTIEGLIKRVILCFLSFVILHILQLVVIVVKCKFEIGF